MKRLLFAFLVAVSSAICIGLLLRSQNVAQLVDASAKLGLRAPATSESFVLTASGELVTESSGSTDGLKARTLGSLDLMLFDASAPEPQIDNKWGKTTIQIGNGLYFFATNDLFANYEIVSDHFSIAHVAKGVFFVDSRLPNEIRIYSLSAILDVGLVTDKRTVTKVSVFPSMLFIYDPTYNGDLENVDTFRIAQVNTLRMVDFSTEAGPKLVFGTAMEEPQKVFAYYRTYAAARDARLRDFYEAFESSDAKSDLTILDRYAMLFVNDEKKRSMLQNSLIESLQKLLLMDKGLCDDTCKKDAGSQDTLIGNITARIDSLAEMDEAYGEEARNLVRRYVALGTLQTEKKKAAYFKEGKSALVTLVGKVFGKRVVIDERYRLLSEMFSSYYFAGAKSEELAKNVDSFIRFLIDGKGIGEKDFLAFVFFLKEYLSLKSGEIDENTIGIAYDMMSIANSYLATLTSDQERFSALSTLFYTFNTIFETMRVNMLANFFDGTPENLTLKAAYLNGDRVTISSDFLSAFKKTIEQLSEFLDKRKAEFYTMLGTNQGDVTDNFVLLSATADKLKELRGILTDYATYRKNLSLTDDSRNATGIVFGGATLSKENLIAYLSRFDGVDPNTVEVLNDFQKDGFYDVRVFIAGYPFTFVLKQPGNVLQGLVYTDEEGKVNEDFKQAAISLDEREKLMREKMTVARTPEDRTRYDFKNYFRTTFFKSVPTGSSTEKVPELTQPTYPEMSPDMQLTVQHELIEKDFRNLASFAPISIKNIYAKVENGVYDIDVYGVRFSVRWTASNYPIEFKSKYVFTNQEHAFAGMSMKIVRDDEKWYEFWGVEMQILPAKIDLANFESSFSELGKYLDRLRRETPTGNVPQTVTIDFESKQIIINGNPYSPLIINN